MQIHISHFLYQHLNFLSSYTYKAFFLSDHLFLERKRKRKGKVERDVDHQAQNKGI